MKIYIKLFDAIPARFNVAIMLFFACWVNYMLRVNMSVNIIAMVPDDSTTASVKSECEAIANDDSSLYNSTTIVVMKRELRQPEGVVTFNWTAGEQAYVLSSYFWGYAVTSFFSGTAAEIWGAKKVVFLTMLFSAILTILTPQAAKWNFYLLFVTRLIIGLLSGFLFPALHALVAHWAPPAEKGKFVSSLLGGAIGTVVTWSLSGPLIEKFGWSYAFYVPGIIGIVWCVAWWFLVYDSPVQHPRISEEEKAYILLAIGDKVQNSKNTKSPPFKSIFTSFPFLAMVILHYGNNWGLYFAMTAAPKFVSSALGFNLTSTGTLSSLPYLARMIFSLIFGAIGDRIIRQNVVSTTFMRKFFCLFSHIVPGLLLIALGYTGCAPILSVVLITFSMGSNGAATLTNLVNHQDLAPNFAGTLYGIANGIGNTAGFVTPLVTAHFTKNGNGFAEWRPIFMTGASLYIASAVYFILFGTGETQQWNYVPPTEEEEEDKRPSASSSETTVTIPDKT